MKKSLVPAVLALTFAAVLMTLPVTQPSVSASVLNPDPGPAAPTKQIVGIVYNLREQRVAGAKVWLVNARSGDTIAETASDRMGRFRFFPVAIGDYEVHAERSDFGYGKVDVKVDGRRTPKVRVMLKPRGVRQ